MAGNAGPLLTIVSTPPDPCMGQDPLRALLYDGDMAGFSGIVMGGVGGSGGVLLVFRAGSVPNLNVFFKEIFVAAAG